MLSNYLKDLLYENDFVIVPGFGAFISRSYPALLDEKNGIIHPPGKRIGFNESMRANDVLLAHHISRKERISYNSAKEKIKTHVEDWKSRLNSGSSVEVDGIGSFTIGPENKLVFTGRKTSNFLASSYGLKEYRLEPVKREKIVPAVRKKIIRRKGPAVYSAYAAASIVLIAFSFIVSLHFQPLKNSLTSSIFSIDTIDTLVTGPSPSVEPGIEETENLPALINTDEEITPSIGDIDREEHKFSIIAGSFISYSNAENLAGKLKEKGYEPGIYDTENAYFRVSLKNFNDSFEAANYLKMIRKKEYPSAWILKQTYDK